MSNGYVHAQGTRKNLYWLLPAGTVSTLFVAVPTAGLLLGALTGHYVTPDYDINGGPVTFTKRQLIRKLGWLGWVWYAYWWPYAKLAWHRGSSHTWPKGSLVRFLYTFWLPLFLTFPYIGPTWWIFWGSVFLGQSVQDLTHLRLDRIHFRQWFGTKNHPHFHQHH